MKKTQFDKLVAQLKERGYKEFQSSFSNEDYSIYKPFHKGDNKWNENRAAYNIFLRVYDYTLHPEFKERMTKEQFECVGMEVHIDISRITDERIECVKSWSDETTIEEVERLAESFYQWVCNEYPEPRSAY